jgi:hypothetical protein
MVARVATACNYKEKCKKLEKFMLAVDSEDSQSPYVPLYRLENFWELQDSVDLDPQLLSLGKTYLKSCKGVASGTQSMGRRATVAFK